MSLQIHYIDIRRCGMSANETTLSSKSQFVKVNHYKSKSGLQQGSLAHTKQQAIKGAKNDYSSVKPICQLTGTAWNLFVGDYGSPIYLSDN